MEIKSIYRYPVKSLPGEALAGAELVAGIGIPGDRAFGFAKHDGPAASENTLRGAEWKDKSAFYVLANEPSLAMVMCRFDGSVGAITLTFPDGSTSHASISDQGAAKAMGAAIGKYLGLSRRETPVLVHARRAGFFDTLDGEISILNLASLAELEKAAGEKIDPLRFRPNIIMDGIPPWQEMEWAGKSVILGPKVGGAVIKFTKPTGRCLATHANPTTGKRDLKTMHLLKDNFGHTQMGVYAHVIGDGDISRGDGLEFG